VKVLVPYIHVSTVLMAQDVWGNLFTDKYCCSHRALAADYEVMGFML
jgi:hypothetical protein